MRSIKKTHFPLTLVNPSSSDQRRDDVSGALIQILMGFRPKASEVLTAYLKQVKEPPWTSYFVKQSSVVNDHFGKSHFNWKVGESNYHVLRTGCFPYLKYHCTKREYQDLTLEDTFMGIIKIMNLGIPTLMYGTAATMLITHKELVHLEGGTVWIYFLLKEHTGAQH